MLIYKPLSITLVKAKLIDKPETKTDAKQLITGIAIAIGLAAIPCVILVLVLQGII